MAQRNASVVRRSPRNENLHMETLIKADIFFFISSVATVVLAVLAGVVLVYFIKVGRNLHRLSESLLDSFKDSEEFVGELKERLDNNRIFRFFFPPLSRHKSSVSHGHQRNTTRDKDKV